MLILCKIKLGIETCHFGLQLIREHDSPFQGNEL